MARGSSVPRGGIFTPTEVEVLEGMEIKEQHNRSKYDTAKHSIRKKVAAIESYASNFFNDLIRLKKCPDETIVETKRMSNLCEELIGKIWESSEYSSDLREAVKRISLTQNTPIEPHPKESSFDQLFQRQITNYFKYADTINQWDAVQFLIFLAALRVNIEELDYIKYIQIKKMSPNVSYYDDFILALSNLLGDYREKKDDVLKKNNPKRKIFVGFDIICYLYVLHEGNGDPYAEPKRIFANVKKWNRAYDITFREIQYACDKLASQGFLEQKIGEGQTMYAINLNNSHKNSFVKRVTVKFKHFNKLPANAIIGSGKKEIRAIKKG